jgi:hypothetical protein
VEEFPSVKTGLLFGDTMEEGFPPGDVAAIAALWCHRVFRCPPGCRGRCSPETIGIWVSVPVDSEASYFQMEIFSSDNESGPESH